MEPFLSNLGQMHQISQTYALSFCNGNITPYKALYL